jgi:hypothetical protein
MGEEVENSREMRVYCCLSAPGGAFLERVWGPGVGGQGQWAWGDSDRGERGLGGFKRGP